MPDQSQPTISSKALSKTVYDLLQNNRAEKAQSICEMALRQAPENPNLLDARGMVFSLTGDLLKAEECFRAALKANPDHSNALNNLGNILREKREYVEAAELYQRLALKVTDQSVVFANLGKALLGAEEFEEAEAALDRSLSLDPANVSARLSMAKLQQKARDIPAAIEVLEAGLAIAPDIELLKKCSHLYQKIEDDANALRHLETAAELFPEDAEILFSIGNIQTNERKYEEAEAAFLRAAELAPDKSEIQNSLGVLYKSQELNAKAIFHYKAALKLDPDNAEAHNNLANTFLDANDKQAALVHFDKALALRPDFDEAWINRTRAHDLSPGHPELERLKAYLENDKLSETLRTNLLFVLAQVHNEIGLYEEAFDYAKEGNEKLAMQEKYERLLHRRVVASVIKKSPTPELFSGGEKAQGPIPIFIIGMSRSGKTTTESILASHPAVIAGGERSSWQHAMKKVRKEKGIAKPFPEFAEEMSGEDFRRMGELYMEEIREECTDARYFVDTMPSNFPYVGLIFQAFPEVKVITCQRHLLDNCLYSYFQRYKNANSYSYDLRDAAAFFADYHTILSHWQNLYGDKILAQTYEGLVGDPEGTTRKLFDFCDLEFKADYVPTWLNDQEVGQWHHYTDQLAPLIEWLESEAESNRKPSEAG